MYQPNHVDLNPDGGIPLAITAVLPCLACFFLRCLRGSGSGVIGFTGYSCIEQSRQLANWRSGDWGFSVWLHAHQIPPISFSVTPMTPVKGNCVITSWRSDVKASPDMHRAFRLTVDVIKMLLLICVGKGNFYLSLKWNKILLRMNLFISNEVFLWSILMLGGFINWF